MFLKSLWEFFQKIDSAIVYAASQNEILETLAYDDGETCQFTSRSQLQTFIVIEQLWNHIIIKDYRFLVKGWYEIFWRHLFRDVITDSMMHESFGRYMQIGNEGNSKTIKSLMASCACHPATPKKEKTVVLCQVSTPKNIRLKTKKRAPQVTASVPSNNIITAFIEEIVYHGKFKVVATIAFPFIHYAVNNLHSVNSEAMDTIKPAVDSFEQTAKYIAINPDEVLVFASDRIINTFASKEIDLITNFVTESEVKLRRTDQEFSDFMNNYNEWMEIVDAVIHLSDYYRKISPQLKAKLHTFLPNLMPQHSAATYIKYFELKLIGWFGSLGALKYNTDIKQAALEAKYLPQVAEEAQVVNELSQDFYKSSLLELYDLHLIEVH